MKAGLTVTHGPGRELLCADKSSHDSRMKPFKPFQTWASRETFELRKITPHSRTPESQVGWSPRLPRTLFMPETPVIAQLLVSLDLV